MRFTGSQRRARRLASVARSAATVVLGILLAAGATIAGAGIAHAGPTPVPAPAVPDPGVRPNPNPAQPNGTPSPIGPPPTTTPSPPSATPTPNPTPGPTPPGWSPSTDDDGDEPGLFDIPGQIRQAIFGFLVWAVETALNPTLELLGETVLATPDLTGNEQVRTIWTTGLVTANAIFVLFVIAGGFIVASRETLQDRYGLKQIAPRLVVSAVAANLSLIVCGKAIELANALSAAIVGQGVDGPTAARAIMDVLAQPLSATGVNLLRTVLTIAVVVLAVVVAITFVLRVAALVLLIGVAPLALACHATPQTEGLAYAWWRAFAACLGLQLGQAVILLATVRVFLTPTGSSVFGVPTTGDGLLGVLVCLTALWLLVKLPSWMRHFVLGPLGRRHGRGLIGQVVHTIVMVKTLGRLAGVRGGHAARRTVQAGTAGHTAARARGSRPRPAPAARPAAGTRRRAGRTPPTLPSAARRGPKPGPAPFSHAPAVHPPLPEPAGASSSPVFSHPPNPATPREATAGGVPPVVFSHPSGSTPPRPTPASRPAPVRFSDAPTPPATTGPRAAHRPGTPAPPTPLFSSTPRPQTAPKRVPAPVTPVFSATPKPSPRHAPTPPPRTTPPTRTTTPTRTATPARATTQARTTTPARATPPPARTSPPTPAPSASGSPPPRKSPPPPARRAGPPPARRQRPTPLATAPASPARRRRPRRDD